MRGKGAAAARWLGGRSCAQTLASPPLASDGGATPAGAEVSIAGSNKGPDIEHR
jgi:hypothetical protein